MAKNSWVLGTAAAMSLAMWAVDASAEKPSTERVWKTVAYETLEHGNYGVWVKPGVVAARQECEWNMAMDAMEASGELMVAPGPRAPVIDWERKSLVLVTLGALSGGLGFEFEVTRVASWGNRLMVDVRISQNPSMSIAETSPYQLFVVDSKSVDLVQVRYESSFGFPQLSHRRGTCSVFPVAETLEATDVSRSSWGSVKARYR
jgi:hypothetical protein